MKLGLLIVSALVPGLVACGGSNYSPIIETCEGGTDAAPAKELVCASNFCGTIADKVTGATADCGQCQAGTQCGDNGVANVCGSACIPLTAPDGDGGTYTVTPACDYYFGSGWGTGYGTELQFPGSCLYTNPATCVPIDIPADPTKPCGATVCGSWICCADNPDGGYPALLPGAVANNDGGLP